MGELGAAYALTKKSMYIQKMSWAKGEVRKNFNDMDFENANKRDEMERYIEDVERILGELVTTLSDISFE